MRTRILLAAVALSASAMAVAQSGTTTITTNNALEPAPVLLQQEPVAPAQPLHQDCLLIAGKSTWQALGLTEDQVTRLGALQERHKAELAPPVEVTGTKGKKAAATKKAEPAVGKTEVIDKTGVEADKQPEQADLEPSKAAPTDNTGTQVPGETTAPDAVIEPLQPVALSVNDELKSILTPEQYVLWSTQCAEIQPTSMR